MQVELSAASSAAGMVQALRRTWLVALVSRLLVLVIGCWAVAAIGYDSHRPVPPRTSENIILDLPSRWDVGWHLGLASHGYRWDGQVDRFETIAFFPAWPALVYASTRFVPHTPVAWAWTGVLVASVLFTFGLAYVYRLCSMDHGSDAARSSTLLLAFYPFSIFFGIPYTEALFLLATAAAFYGCRQRAVGATAAWGFLAGLTRPNGCLLTGPLLLLALPAVWREAPGGSRRLGLACAALAPLVGMLAYSAYVWHLTGDPFLWATAQPTWGRAYRGLLTLFGDESTFLRDRGLYTLLTERPYDALNMLATVGALAAAWPVTRRLGAASGLLVVLNCLAPLLAGGWPSMGRYTSVLFPVFIWLGSLLPGNRILLPLCGFALGQALIAALFFTFRPMY